MEYYEDASAPTGWTFSSNLYGIMTHTTTSGTYSVRINEWLNADSKTINSSNDTIGSFTGFLNTLSAPPLPPLPMIPQMTLEYTGETKMRNKFGAQHLIVQLQN